MVSAEKPALPPSQSATARQRTLAFLGALCLFLSVLEYLFPKPPFFRLGLANLPILLALPVLDFYGILGLLVLKVTGQALVGGTLASYVFLFSLAGSSASVLVMYLAHRLAGPFLSFVGIGCAGALASNLVQTVLSLGFIFGPSAWVMAPVFLFLGLAAGVVIGFLAQFVSRHSTWYQGFLVCGGLPPPRPEDPSPGQSTSPSKPVRRKRPADRLGRILPPGPLFVWGLVVLVLYMFQGREEWRFLQLPLLFVLARLSGTRPSLPYFLMMAGGIIAFQLPLAQGLVLVKLWGLHVTQGALLQGIHKAAGITGMVFLSLATVRPGLRIPGLPGRILGMMFCYYEALMDRRFSLQRKNLTGQLDRLLYSLSQEAVEKPPQNHRPSTIGPGGGSSSWS